MMERGFLLHTMSLQSLSTVVAALEEHRKHLQVDSVELMEVCETTGIENRRLQQQARVCPDSSSPTHTA